MANPELSIIIPTINEEETIGLLIDEIKSRGDKFVEKEIIIADAGSRDNTAKIAADSGARVVHCEVKGRAAQMNRGARSASGSVLYFLHADTIPPEHYDRKILMSVRNGFPAGCFQLRFDKQNVWYRLYGWFTRFKATWLRFGDQSLYAEKQLFDRISGFREDLILMEDQEIVSRIKKSSPFRLENDHVTTSARRFEVNGVIRLQLIFGLIVALYYMGVEQGTLVHIYRTLIKS